VMGSVELIRLLSDDLQCEITPSIVEQLMLVIVGRSRLQTQHYDNCYHLSLVT
jgi:hypothetical protein